MNTEYIENEGRVVTPAPVEKMYQIVPWWEQLLVSVRSGRAEFEEYLNATGLRDIGLSTSAVHDELQVEIQAFVLGIPSEDRWEEVETKSFLTYASHWIDDFFDSPARVGDPKQLLRDRHDIRVALANMGPAGKVGFAMADRAQHPAGVYKALHRMLYGGLVQRSRDSCERQMLVREYFDIATQSVNRLLAGQLRRLQPEAYWTTNKTVLEMLSAAEPEMDFTISELWNCVYAPALYYEDLEEECARGEASFSAKEQPRMDQMLRMVRLGAKLLAPIYAPGSSQLLQLEFLTRVFENLPPEIASEYHALWSGSLVAHASDPHLSRPHA